MIGDLGRNCLLWRIRLINRVWIMSLINGVDRMEVKIASGLLLNQTLFWNAEMRNLALWELDAEQWW